MRRRLVSWGLGLCLLSAAAALHPIQAQTCTSSTGCTECESLKAGMLRCVFVNNSGSCQCEVYTFGGTPACALTGDCTYTPTGGGGGGGGAGGGTGSGCTRPAGGWCPADCSSCTTVYWY
jgi:hypothetical protein